MPSAPAMQADAVRRTARNAAWLLSSKGAGGVLSLAYLALVARTLGLHGFGLFALILAYAQGLSQLSQFQSWQIVVRYGAVHLSQQRTDRLRRVVAFAAALELAGALAGAMLAAGGALVAGPWLGWSPAQQQSAALFGIGLALSLRSTPTGVLRLLDRFGLAAITETATPLLRLIGSVIAWRVEAGLAGFLAAWIVAEAATGAALWIGATRALGERGVRIGRPSLRGVIAENDGVWRFAWMTHVSMSLHALWQQAGILAVGASGSAAAAGGFRLAFQIAQALTKPAASLARAVFPELALLTAGGGAAARQLVGRLSRLALAGAAVMAVAVLLVGEPLLRAVGGAEFVFAYPLLLVLVVASAIDLAGFALEPALLAGGRAGAALAIRSAASVIYLLCLFVLIGAMGAMGAAIAMVVGTALLTAGLALAVGRR